MLFAWLRSSGFHRLTEQTAASKLSNPRLSSIVRENAFYLRDEISQGDSVRRSAAEPRPNLQSEPGDKPAELGSRKLSVLVGVDRSEDGAHLLLAGISAVPTLLVCR